MTNHKLLQEREVSLGTIQFPYCVLSLFSSKNQLDYIVLQVLVIVLFMLFSNFHDQTSMVFS